MKVSNRLNGIGEYYFSRKLREIDELNKQGKNVINLGIGSPDLPPHPEVIKTLQEESLKSNVHGYQSYKGSPVLRKAISDWYRKWYGVYLDADTEILPMIGSKEGLVHICMTYFEEGSTVLIPNPGYPTYSAATQLSGATPVYYELLEKNNYQPDFELLENTIRNSTQAVRGIFVNYPQMPTGQLPTRKLFEDIVGFGRRNSILVIHDNPYSFILNDQPMSLLGCSGARDCVVELNSLSKSHNMAGWRVGMLCGAKDKIDDVLRFKSNMDSGMFLPVQLAAAKALSLEEDWYQQLNDVYRKRRREVFGLLDALDCRYSKQQGGLFVWSRIGPRYKDCYDCSDEVLSKHAVFITPGGIFGKAGEGYVRVSLCATEEKIAEARKRIVNN